MSEMKELATDEEKKSEGGDIEMQIQARRSSTSKSKRMMAFAASEHRGTGAHNIEPEEVTAQRKESFIASTGLSSEEADRRLQQYGRNQLPDDSVPKWYLLLSQFWKPMAIMLWIAAIVEGAIQQFADMGILLGILFINAFIAFYETIKAGDAVAALKRTLIPTATVCRDGEFKAMDATQLVPGDLVLLASGSAVPADCIVNDGEIQVDEAALTGESLPAPKYRGDSCKMGSTVVQGETHGTVESTGGNTFVGRTAKLLTVSASFLHLAPAVCE
jgi:H+-transporting ATPase